MINFTVEDLGHDGHQASVRDQHGRLHVVEVVGTTPEVGDQLFGQEAVMGSRVLVNQASHKPLAVRFEALACTQGEALERLHPAARPQPAALAGESLTGPPANLPRRHAAPTVPSID